MRTWGEGTDMWCCWSRCPWSWSGLPSWDRLWFQMLHLLAEIITIGFMKERSLMLCSWCPLNHHRCSEQVRWVAAAYILLLVLHQQNQELFRKPLPWCTPKACRKICLLDLLVNILYFLPEGNMVADLSRRQAAELAEKIFFFFNIKWCPIQ